MIRPPTDKEWEDIATYLVDQCRTDPQYAGAMCDQLRDSNYVAVVDKFISDGPGYAGSVILIVYPGGPELHDVLVYGDYGLYRVVRDG